MTPVLLIALATLEAGLYVRACFEAYRCHYSSVGAAYAAMHWRLVAAMFVWLGGLVLTLARRGAETLASSQRCMRLTGAATQPYWALHGALVAHFAAAVATVSRKFKRQVIAPGDPPAQNTALALSGAQTGRSGGGDDDVSGEDGAGLAVAWHGRVVSAVLGTAAGAAVGGVVYLTGLYRLPGAAVHGFGSIRLIIALCVAAGLGLGMVVHEAETGGSPADGLLDAATFAVRCRRAPCVARHGSPGQPCRPSACRVTHSGTFLGWHKGRRIWATLKDVVLVLAPPQTGKTAYLGGRIIEAPGSVLATSTKADVFVHTRRCAPKPARYGYSIPKVSAASRATSGGHRSMAASTPRSRPSEPGICSLASRRAAAKTPSSGER